MCSLALTEGALAGSKKSVPDLAARPLIANPPLTAMISLNKQRLYLYDANGLVVQSRVSTGSSGYDTPKGIYSVIHKKEMHESNLYEGAPMPHMQRLLWSGIALHGGEVPRYAASHGCIRLPYGFAEKFYSLTKLNDRIIIAPDVQAPVPINHPRLFAALPPNAAKAASLQYNSEAKTQLAAMVGDDTNLTIQRGGRTLEQVRAERDAENQRHINASEAAAAELVIARERIAPAQEAVKFALATLKKARVDERAAAKAVSKTVGQASDTADRLKQIQKKIAAGASKMRADRLMALQADEAKAIEKAERARAPYDAATAAHLSAKSAVAGYERLLTEATAKLKAANTELDRRTTGEEGARLALENFQLTERNFPKPLSIFISSKTRMISLRQGMEPVVEGPITLSEPNKPLGTYLFTAMSWRDESNTALNWNVVGVDEKGEWDSPRVRDGDAAKLPLPTNPVKAQMALDRVLTIPPHVRAKIAELVKPGSTFIISDYDMSRSETGKGTDFIVQMPEVLARNWTPEYLAMKKKGLRYDPYASYGDEYFASALGQPRPLRFTRPYRLGQVVPVTPPKPVEVSKSSPRWHQPSLARQFGFSFD